MEEIEIENKIIVLWADSELGKADSEFHKKIWKEAQKERDKTWLKVLESNSQTLEEFLLSNN